MISGLSPGNQQFLASLNILQNNLSQADEQLSSGLSVNQASDAPQSIQDIFETRAELGQPINRPKTFPPSRARSSRRVAPFRAPLSCSIKRFHLAPKAPVPTLTLTTQQAGFAGSGARGAVGRFQQYGSGRGVRL